MSTYGAKAFVDCTNEALKQHALERGEAVLASNGALSVTTGKRTGRSPLDRYIVQDATTEKTVDWGNVNRPIDGAVFSRLWEKAVAYASEKEVFVSHLQVGADAEHHLPVKVVTEFAWHNLFTRNLFIRPDHYTGTPETEWTILNTVGVPTSPEEDGVNSDGTVLLNFTERKVLLCNMRYAGEMKKAMFTALNFILPGHDVLPMHCAANQGKDGDVALFFGLSGTGKTTLSSDPERLLIGDDEHGWSNTGVFNFEGGCYAKCIDLTEEREPVIYQAIRDGAVMENVVLKDGEPDYTDDSLTKNSRVGYPREHIEQRVLENAGGKPSVVIFLTCDLYGVLPPVAELNKEQAAYYFLSGYTAKVAGTELGASAEVQPAFSTCFGAPFFPRPAGVYAELLMKRMTETGAKVYLVNTGWTGGGYGQGGKRFAIKTTRAVVHAIMRGDVEAAPMDVLPHLGLRIPTELPGVEADQLDPRKTWSDLAQYEANVLQLVGEFQENFKQFDVDASVVAAGPKKES